MSFIIFKPLFCRVSLDHYTHIELAEREQIQKALGAGKTIAAIARSLTRDPKTIAHEIKTNQQAIYKGETAEKIV
ncbi:helix-turn-helix domain-containing protein [Oscillospiraceae bacterium HV4-5-C5C]|nr:helix-turn-helix domain-containing protein [Oscillospiraceae bacterium HV4-5-C5C]